MALKWNITSRVIPVLLVGSILLAIPSSFSTLVKAQEDWLPVIPESSWVDLSYRKGGYSLIDMVITFPSGGYIVSEWGTPTINGTVWWVIAEIWWTNPYVVLPFPVTESHSYNLGRPPAGEYTFLFAAWFYSVTHVNFTVSYISGDINRDGIVNVQDLMIVSLAYGTFEGEPDYNPEADINKDSIVDMRDLFIVARNLGHTDP